MAERSWEHMELEELFDDPVPKWVSLRAFLFDADSDDARAFLLEPLPFLKDAVAEIDDEWQVSLFRINANRVMSGPRKVCAGVALFPELKLAHVVAYRLPQRAG